MPTSLPRQFAEIRFPAEFTAHYEMPLSWFGAGRVSGGTGGNPDGLEWPPVDGFANDSQVYHKQKALDAVRGVAQHIRNLQVQRINQTTHMPYNQMAHTADEMAFLSGVGQVRGGARYGGTPTTIEGERVLAGRGLRGGVMRTQAGRQYVASRLKSRVDELNARDAVAANEPPPQAVGNPEQEGDAEIMAIGEYMDILNDNFTSGAIDSEAIDAARKLLKNLSKVGFRIPQNLITPILRQVEEMLSIIEAVANSQQESFAPSGERRKRLRTIFQILERVRRVLDELSSVSDLSTQERAMALQASQPALTQMVEAQRGRFPRSLPQALPVERGETGYIYPYPTYERPGRRPEMRPSSARPVAVESPRQRRTARMSP
jgi:hypothetical protein